MTQARLVSVDVPGLNLLLGGGVPVLARHKGADESAVLLVRGPPGSGKTVLGTQLAGALARALVPGKMMDVAYGCVELLPVELAAQHAGLKPPDLPERVIIPPFPVDTPEPHTGGECRIYANLLALELGQEQAGIETAVKRLLKLVEDAGGKPRVVVIDSLSDGYNLGSQAPRILADALCKLAVARGMIFILLEETIDGRSSDWSFAADVVVELQQRTERGHERQERTIHVAKHRFGRAEPGPHSASIKQGSRYTIWPEPSAYVSGFWTPLQQFRRQPKARDWGEPHLDERKDGWPRVFNQTVVVTGTNPSKVQGLAYSLAAPNKRKGEIDLSIHISDTEDARADFSISDPYMSGAQLLSLIVSSTKLVSQEPLTRVILGDARSLRIFSSREEVIRSIMVLSALLHDAKIPLILFDSSGPSGVFDPARGPAGSDLPLIAEFADVQIVGWTAPGGHHTVTATHSPNHRVEWDAVL